MRVRFLLFAVVTMLSFPVSAQDAGRPDAWTEATHGVDAAPDYAVVFPQDSVNTMTIAIAPDEWRLMLDDMTELAGEFGAGRGGQRRPGSMDGQPPAEMQQGGFPGNPGGDFFGGENPIWVPVDVTFNGALWTNVGMRFKGNSSLSGTWRSGIYKLPFKLDFDEFEDDYPDIDNQRFYGFKELSFSSNWSDDSLLREKVTADVFRAAGLAAPQTAFYAVTVDAGSGPVYFGLYTAVEVVEDTVIRTQFTDGSGNVYKPEGGAATFAAGTFNEDGFSKETNEDEADFADVQALYDALHDDARFTDPAAWRARLETAFDVDTFLRWLAANTVVQNWDTYGQMAHNYYLYNDPETRQLTWIPWDNNMALSDGFGRGRGGLGGSRPDGSLSFEKRGIGDEWPLIRYLLDDAEYYGAYVAYLDDVSRGAFEPSAMAEAYTRLHELVTPYVVGETGEQHGYSNLTSAGAFEASLAELIGHAQARYEATQAFIAGGG